jgi:hypothetical protein
MTRRKETMPTRTLTRAEVTVIEQGLAILIHRTVAFLGQPWKSPAEIAGHRLILDAATSALRKMRGAP